MWANLLLRFMDLMVAKGKVSDLPHSLWLLLSILLLDTALAALTYYFFDGREIFARVVVIQIISCGFVYALLWFRSRQARAVQTLTAITGVQLPLEIMSLFVAFVYQAAGAPKQGPIAGFIALTVLLLMFWQIMVSANVLRQAADWAYAEAILAMMAMLFATYWFMRWFEASVLQLAQT